MEVSPAILGLLLFFLLVLPLPEVFRFLIRVPLSLRYFLGGASGLAAYGAAHIPGYATGDMDAWIQLGLFLFSPLWFSIGARRSLKDVIGQKAKALRWLNVAGFAASVGLVLPWFSFVLQRHGYRAVIELTFAVVVVLAFSRVVLWRPPTSLRWSGILHRFPVILVALVVLGIWAALSTFPRGDSLPHEWGLPFWFVMGIGRGGFDNFIVIHFKVGALLIDVGLALATAYMVALGVDRFVFSKIRSAREGKQGQEESK